MNNVEFQQRYCTIGRSGMFWLKLAQMLSAVLAIVLCVIFNESARVHMIDSHYFYSISLKFPFSYESNVTVQASPDLPLRKFKFDTLLLPSVITFVATIALAFVMTSIIFTLNLTRHGLQETQKYIKLNFFISVGLTFVLLAGICLWMTSLIALVKDVKREVDFLFGQCKENFGMCVKKEATFIKLYISMVFGICLFFLSLFESIRSFIKMVYTIPAQITLTALVPNVELENVGRQ